MHHLPFPLQTFSLAKTLSNGAMLMALKRLGYKGKMTGHGFRAVASTVMNEQRVPPGRYRTPACPLRAQRCARRIQSCGISEGTHGMMQWWADYLDSLVNGSKVIVGNFGGGAA